MAGSPEPPAVDQPRSSEPSLERMEPQGGEGRRGQCEGIRELGRKGHPQASACFAPCVRAHHCCCPHLSARGCCAGAPRQLSTPAPSCSPEGAPPHLCGPGLPGQQCPGLGTPGQASLAPGAPRGSLLASAETCSLDCGGTGAGTSWGPPVGRAAGLGLGKGSARQCVSHRGARAPSLPASSPSCRQARAQAGPGLANLGTRPAAGGSP